MVHCCALQVGLDWVREVHRHTSVTKRGTNYVVFRCSSYSVTATTCLVYRNSRNEKFHSLQELVTALQSAGLDPSHLQSSAFRSDKVPLHCRLLTLTT